MKEIRKKKILVMHLIEKNAFTEEAAGINISLIQ